MPDWVIALLVGGMGLFGVVLGIMATFFWQWRDSQERFRVMTFDKRLEAHNRAYYWCNEINKALNLSSAQEIYQTADKVRDWWNGSCLLLDQDSREKMLYLINLALLYAVDKKAHDDGKATITQQVSEGVWRALYEAMKAVEAGIGHKHLPQATKSAGKREVM